MLKTMEGPSDKEIYTKRSGNLNRHKYTNSFLNYGSIEPS